MTTKHRPEPTTETTPTAAPGHVTVVRIPRFDDLRDEKFTQIAVTTNETLTRLTDLVERLAAERDRPALAARPPAALPPRRALATSLDEYRVVCPPFLERLFRLSHRLAQTQGLAFPPSFDLAFVDASPDRPCDGATVRSASGAIRVVINANAPNLLETMFHELAHVADFWTHGTRFARDKMERRAATFVQSMKAPAPKALPEPARVRDLSSWHGAGSRTSYAVGIAPPVREAT